MSIISLFGPSTLTQAILDHHNKEAKLNKELESEKSRKKKKDDDCSNEAFGLIQEADDKVIQEMKDAINDVGDDHMYTEQEIALEANRRRSALEKKKRDCNFQKMMASKAVERKQKELNDHIAHGKSKQYYRRP
jgi:hypothetical protein